MPPISTCRSAENHPGRPLNDEVPQPTRPRPARHATMLPSCADGPAVTKNGSNGHQRTAAVQHEGNYRRLHRVAAALLRVDAQHFARKGVQGRARVAHDLVGGAPGVGREHALALDHRDQPLPGPGGIMRELVRHVAQALVVHLAAVGHRQPFAQRHRASARGQARQPGQDDGLARGRRALQAHHQAEAGHQPVVDAQHGCAQGVAARSMEQAPHAGAEAGWSGGARQGHGLFAMERCQLKRGLRSSRIHSIKARVRAGNSRAWG
jgi:hypothetical protein